MTGIANMLNEHLAIKSLENLFTTFDLKYICITKIFK